MSILKTTFAAAVLVGLTACGGGGTTGTSNDTVIASTDSALTIALSTGDSRNLGAADGDSMMLKATSLATEYKSRQTNAVASIFGSVSDLTLNLTRNSSKIATSNAKISAPFILSDSGNGMAAIAQIASGRGLAYGADALGWMSGSSIEQQHRPLFDRAFNWVLTGDGSGAIPKTMAVGSAGYNTKNIVNYATRRNSVATISTCKVEDPANTCWQSLDVIVFGTSAINSSGLSALVRSYLEAGKPVIYMQASWGPSDGATSVLGAMGMVMGGGSGNYFNAATDYSVGVGRTVAKSVANADQFSPLLDTLQMLSRPDLTVDFSVNTAPIAQIDSVKALLTKLETSGGNVFTDPDAALYKMLVLMADVWRTKLVYGAPLAFNGDSDNFLRAYASDSWIAYNRSATTTPPNGSGDFMPAAAKNIAVSTTYEEITVYIPQTSGSTVIGRAAIPGKAVTIQILDAAGVPSLGVQASFIRTSGKPLTDAVYARPRDPDSIVIPLKASGDTNFVSPFGGPLNLSFGGAKAGTTVKLRIKGVAKYAHFDFSDPARPMDPTEYALATAALTSDSFSWMTAKLRSGEIQQTIGYARKSIGTQSPRAYVEDIQEYLFNTNHRAKGYTDIAASAQVTQLCAQMGWDCTGPLHDAPGTQHMVGWLAACGGLCAGNPIDAFDGVNLGWGWHHELGHNTVQRIMHITPDGTNGCVVECDNNILASAGQIRLWNDRHAINGGPNNYDHIGLYKLINTSRATGLTGDAQRADMQTRLWDMANSNPMQAVHGQLAFLYSKYRLGLQKPNSDALLDFYSLLNKGDRMVSKAWDSTSGDKYGMGLYANNTVTNHELLYALSSKIIGRDLRNVFAMYGLPLSATALDSVARLALPIAPLDFYAQPTASTNKLDIGQWVVLPTNGLLAAYPY